MNRNANKSLPINKLISIAIAFVCILVIAIFGIKFFTGKISNSSAISELKQVQQVILSDLLSMDGSEDITVNCDGITFEYDVSSGRVKFSGKLNTNDDGLTFTKEIKNKFKDISKLDGTFGVEDSVITYTTKNGKGHAYWESGQLPSSSK